MGSAEDNETNTYNYFVRRTRLLFETKQSKMQIGDALG